jgi:WD40 repeat protein
MTSTLQPVGLCFEYVACADGTIKIVNILSAKVVNSLTNLNSKEEQPAMCVRFKPPTEGKTSNFVLGVSADGSINQWGLPSGIQNP